MTVVKQETHVRVVREWCVSLGVLTAISISRHEAEMKLAAYVPMLMREFPDAAFTTESLQHVARQCAKGFPTYPELANHLSTWWRGNRPVIALPPPPPPPAWREEPTEEEREYVRQVAAKTIAALRSSAQALDEQREKLWQAQEHRARYLTAEELDRINPLPGGRTRVVQGATTEAVAANDEDEPPPDAA